MVYGQNREFPNQFFSHCIIATSVFGAQSVRLSVEGRPYSTNKLRYKLLRHIRHSVDEAFFCIPNTKNMSFSEIIVTIGL